TDRAEGAAVGLVEAATIVAKDIHAVARDDDLRVILGGRALAPLRNVVRAELAAVEDDFAALDLHLVAGESDHARRVGGLGPLASIAERNDVVLLEVLDRVDGRDHLVTLSLEGRLHLLALDLLAAERVEDEDRDPDDHETAEHLEVAEQDRHHVRI